MKTQQDLNKYLLSELKKQKQQTENYKELFEKEKNIKNGLYFFILNNGMFEKLKEYEPLTDYQKTDYHNKSLLYLISNLPESKN